MHVFFFYLFAGVVTGDADVEAVGSSASTGVEAGRLRPGGSATHVAYFNNKINYFPPPLSYIFN